MFTRIMTVGVLVCLLVGCGKKTAKVADNSDDTTPPPRVEPQQRETQPNQTSGKGTVDKSGKKSNWLDDPRFRPTNQLPVDAPDKKPEWGTAKLPPVPPGGVGTFPPNPGAGGQPPMPMATPQPPAVPQPPPMTTPATAAQKVTKDDMKDVWIFIENFSLASGKMPGPDLVYAALIQAGSPAASMVKDGSIVLSGARVREGIWAFEKNAPTNGGWIASQNGPEQVTAAEFARRAREQ